MILINARLMFPDGIRDGFEVVVEKGKIAAIREQTQKRGEEVIDLHVHGALGRDTMEASVEAFHAICDYHASGGTTSLLLTTATASIDKLVDVLRTVRDLIADAEIGTPRRGVG